MTLVSNETWVRMAEDYGVLSEDLDEAVQDLFLAKASQVNNDGLAGQIAFLREEGLDDDQLREILDRASSRHFGRGLRSVPTRRQRDVWHVVHRAHAERQEVIVEADSWEGPRKGAVVGITNTHFVVHGDDFSATVSFDEAVVTAE